MSTSSTRTVILVGSGADTDDLVLKLRINSIPVSHWHYVAIAESLSKVKGTTSVFVAHLPASIATTEEDAMKALIERVEAFLRTRPSTED